MTSCPTTLKRRGKYVVAPSQRASDARRSEMITKLFQKHSSYILRAVEDLFGLKSTIDDFALKIDILGNRAIADEIAVLSFKTSTPAETATHEAGHFVALEYEGLPPYKASISGSLFGRNGWSGRVIEGADIYLGGRYGSPNPEDLNRFCRIILAGPIAEELVAGGQAISNYGELVSARLYSDRAANLKRVSRSDNFENNVQKTIAMVGYYSDIIAEIGALLRKRKEITRFSPSVRKILARINGQIPVQLTKEGKLLHNYVTSEVSSVIEFINSGEE